MANAWPLDILTRLVKFVKAGGVFICGGYRFEDIQTTGRIRWIIYRGDGSGKDGRTRWSKVFEKAQSQLYLPWAGAYGLVGADPDADPPKPGRPTFIMVGQESYFGTSEGDPPFDKVIILASRDGESWSETFTEKHGYGYAAAWDENNKKFLAQCITDVAQNAYTHSVFASTDGFSWSRIETKPGHEFGATPQPSALMTATGTLLVKDTLGNIVPNGSYYGENKGVGIIRPQVLNPYFFQASGTGATEAVEIIKREVDPVTGAVTITRSNKSMPFPVASVAYAGGVYQACGNTASEEGSTWKIASSSDDGERWTTDLSLLHHHGICVMANRP